MDINSLEQSYQSRVKAGTFVDPLEANAQVQAAAKSRKKPNFIQSLFPSIGGIAGGAGGGALGGALAGSAILPGVGTVAGGLIGALLGGGLGGAAGKVAENAATGDGLGHDVAKEGLIQGALSAGPIRLLKGAKAATEAGVAGERSLAAALNAGGEAAAAPGVIGRLLGKTAKGTEQAAGGTAAGDVLKTSTQGKLKTAVNKQLADQYGTISKPIARATNPIDTIGTLAKAGITKPQDAERIAGAITGTDGILNKSVLKAVGNAKRVNTDGLPQIFSDALESQGIVEGDKKSLQAIFKSQLNRLNGGPAGSIDPLSHPNDVLDVMKSLESRANDYLGKSGTAHLATSTDKAKAKVLMTLRDELQGRLYDGSGANENVSKVLTPEVRKQLLDLAPGNSQWAKHVDTNIMSAKDVTALRAAQKPFVNISKILDEGDKNALTFGGRVANSASSLRGQLAEKTIGAGKTGAARLMAGAVNGTGKLAGGEIAPWGAKQIAARTLTPGLAGALSAAQQPVPDQSLMNSPMNDSIAQIPSTQSSNASMLDPLSADPTAPSNADTGAASIFDPVNLETNVKKIIMSGGKMKDVQDYVSLVDALQKIAAPPKAAKLSGSQIQQANNAQSALTDLSSLAQSIQADPGVLKKASIPGGQLARAFTGTTGYEAAKQNVVDVIARLRSGAAITADEAKRYMTLLPGYADSQQTALDKLKRLNALLSAFADPQTSQSDLASIAP